MAGLLVAWIEHLNITIGLEHSVVKMNSVKMNPRMRLKVTPLSSIPLNSESGNRLRRLGEAINYSHAACGRVSAGSPASLDTVLPRLETYVIY